MRSLKGWAEGSVQEEGRQPACWGWKGQPCSSQSQAQGWPGPCGLPACCAQLDLVTGLVVSQGEVPRPQAFTACVPSVRASSAGRRHRRPAFSGRHACVSVRARPLLCSRRGGRGSPGYGRRDGSMERSKDLLASVPLDQCSAF